MRKITDIIVHCSASPNGRIHNAKDIDDWHLERGFKRGELWRQQFNPDYKAIGYHFVIGVSGMVETGRSTEEVGAHCQGANASSLGICLIGTDKFSKAQWSALADLLGMLKITYPSAVVHGHRHYASAIAQGKQCPGFDVESFVADGYVADDRHIL